MSSTSNSTQVGQPWWRFGMVWMVVGGPAVVVVAGLTPSTLLRAILILC
jgi:hypothetical protein